MVNNDSEKQADSTPRWASRIKQRVESVEKPKKVTSDDVLARWDDSYTKRQDLLKSAKKPNTVAKIVTGVSLLGALLMGMSTQSGGSSFDTDSKKNQTQISSLKDQLADVQNEKTKKPAQKDAATLIVDANTQAHEVADIQNKMDAVPYNDPSDKVIAMSADMAKHLDGGAKVASSPWYSITRDKSSNPAHWNDQYAWEAQTPYAFTSDGQNIRVVWFAKDTKTHQLLAWAIGDYSSVSKKFQGVLWGETVEGARRVGTASDANPGLSGNQANSGTSTIKPPASQSASANALGSNQPAN